jgi:hypothetical protein
MHIFSSDGQSRPSAYVRALSAGLGIYAAHLMPPVAVIVLVASVTTVIITVVLTAVFWNPELPPGVSAGWLLCVLLGRSYEPPARRGELLGSSDSTPDQKGGREKP